MSDADPPPRVTVQLHPDWPHRGRTVAESLADAGAYLSQFATGISNGGLTAHPGGDRWRWESRLFGGRYDDAAPQERPVYGAWDRRDDPWGPAVRFGSAFLRLRPEVVQRSTFCFPDSAFEPEEVVGPEQLPLLGRLADASGLDDLDAAVEAHVHGGVLLGRDVEAVVLDPCFAGTVVEAAAGRFGCEVRWHPGFRLDTSTIDPTYRGPEAAALAQRLSPVLTPDVLGDAARAGAHPPWLLKQVWHLLARFGRAGA